MPSIKCTNCGAVLKTPNVIPPGKKVKCPKCNEAFVVGADEEEEPKKPAKEEEEEAADDEGGDEDEAPKKKKAKGSDADDGGDDDDGASKKGKGDGEKKKNNTTMIIIIAVVVVFFCCCGCGGVGTIFRTAIQGMLGFGEIAAKAAAEKKMEDDIKKALEDAAKK